jgi:hypothetical protein
MCTSFPRSGVSNSALSSTQAMGRIMSASVTLPVAIATFLALISLGGGVYEFLVIDPFWPRRPDFIQPNRGGISRRQFWIPAHTAFELALIAALVMAWSLPEVCFWLLVALISHIVMRVWSLLDFVPKALTFERSHPGTITESTAPLDTSEPLAATVCTHAGGVRSCGTSTLIGQHISNGDS